MEPVSSILFISSVVYCLCLKHIKKPKRIPTPPTPLEVETKRFLSLFSDTVEAPNHNIHPDVFDMDKLRTMQKQESHTYEGQWKTRILMQPSPQGNVIMYYDLFKEAFVYYADRQLTYAQLNMHAMKYVRLYGCRDFFLDTAVLPDDVINPFNQMRQDEVDAEKQKKQEKRDKLKLDFDSSVFVKKKSSEKDKTDDKDNATETKKEAIVPVKPKCINNFRYLGKTTNFSMLQPIPKSTPSCITQNYQYVKFKQTSPSSSSSSSSYSSSLSSSSSFATKFEKLFGSL